jgi:hypothetical protein
MAITARNMTAKLHKSMQKRVNVQKVVQVIRNAAPSRKAADAAISLVLGLKHGGTRRKRR